MSDLARPTGPGSCPDGLSPSVSGHSACDPSRGWRPIEDIIAEAEANDGWLGPMLFANKQHWGWEIWVGQCDAAEWWLGRNGSGGCFDCAVPSHAMPLPAPPAQGMEAPVAETEGLGAKPDSPVGSADAPDPKREGETQQKETAA